MHISGELDFTAGQLGVARRTQFQTWVLALLRHRAGHLRVRAAGHLARVCPTAEGRERRGSRRGRGDVQRGGSCLQEWWGVAPGAGSSRGE